MKADGGTDGNDVVQPSSFLLVYWMGRYHGFIEGPRVADSTLVGVEPNRGVTSGAKPYVGPPRPKTF